MTFHEGDLLHRVGEAEGAFNYRAKVLQGLGLKGVVPDIPFAVELGITTDIAKNLIIISRELEIPLPSIGVILPKDPLFKVRSQSGEEIYTLANASIPDENPEGLIKFSEGYLDHLISFRMGYDEEIPRPIEWVVSHEAYHLWQHKHTPKRIALDCIVQYKNGAEAWETTQSEIDANEYANRWLERHYGK